MEILSFKLQDNKDCYIYLCDTQHVLQVYANGKQGNIKRFNGTVLVRFDIDEYNIDFCFSKKNNPMEFGYDKYSISLEAGLSAVKNIPHYDAEELYMVLSDFMNNN